MTNAATLAIVTSSVALLAMLNPARDASADIFQWEYINPADPNLGKQQSSTLAPDGAGVDAGQGANLSNRNLTGAYLSGAILNQADLTGTSLFGAILNGASLIGANLTNANAETANLTNARLSQANLTNARLYDAILDNADLNHANLTNASFGNSTMTGADLSGAEVRGARFYGAWGTVVGEVTAAQLYSTASYQTHDMTGIVLSNLSLGGINLAGQNLSHADFMGSHLSGADLSHANLTNANFAWGTAVTGANLSHANLTNANFAGYDSCDEISCVQVPGTDFTGANLSGADAREADIYLAILGANINMIFPEGGIGGLDLTSGASLVVRDYENYADVGVPILIYQYAIIDATGTLRLEFDADSWDSTISFVAGIPVTRGGTLELSFADDVNPVSQIGRTIDLFDWTGVMPTGTFNVSSPYIWNLSKLYTTGEVTLVAVPTLLSGDYDGSGTVGPEDYNVWKANYGSTTMLAADGNGNRVIDAADYTVWRNHLGQSLGAGSGAAGYPLGASAGPLSPAVPEPATGLLTTIAALTLPTRCGGQAKATRARR